MARRLVPLLLLTLAGCAPREPWPGLAPAQPQAWQQQPQAWQAQPWTPATPQPWAPQPAPQPWGQPPPPQQPQPGAPARPLTGPRGTLTVRTRPAGAMVFLRGVFVGGTPLERFDVETGTFQLVLVLPRYEPIFSTVTVRAGESVVQDLAFSVPAPSSPAPSPEPWPGPSRGGGYDDGGCSQSECQRDCFRDGFHCKTDCGYGNANCEMTCRQLERSCQRSCERGCR